MTPKQKVLSVYPNAVSKWSKYEIQYVIAHRPEAHIIILGMGDTRKMAWQSAADAITNDKTK